MTEIACWVEGGLSSERHVMQDIPSLSVFFIMSFAVVYSIILGWVASIRAMRLARWVDTRFPAEWRATPWFFRRIGPRKIALKLFAQRQPNAGREFETMYSAVRNCELHSWLSLILASVACFILYLR